jgi:hypothetical protein
MGENEEISKAPTSILDQIQMKPSRNWKIGKILN